MIKAEKTELQGVYKTDPGVFVFDNPSNQVAEYKRQKKLAEMKEREIEVLKDKINNMDEDIREMKSILKLIAEKVSQ